MNSKQELYDKEVDVLWYGGINDVHECRLAFYIFAEYLDAINYCCDSWQSAH
jgi:hypothetical protein